MKCASNAIPSFGGSGLRRTFTILTALILLSASVAAFGAGKMRMRWVTSIYSGPNGVGLKFPEGVACGKDYLVVADTGNSRLLRFSYEGEAAIPEAEFPLPKSAPIVVQVNSKGQLYFLDGAERRILGVSATGEALGALKPNGLPWSAEVVPKSFRIDDEDNVYILDIFSAAVLVLDAGGKYSRHVSFPEEYGFFSDLAVDQQGTILLLDSVEAVVYSAAATAEHFSPLTKSLKEYVNFPTGLSTDARGVIYVVDQYGSGLALIAADGSFLGRRLGMGWKESGLYFPSQVCVNQDGVVFIADRNNSRVQIFTVGQD
jgi:sugar lactone lactonase YvrE